VFAETDRIAPLVVADARQVSPHDEQAAPGRALQVLRSEGVRNLLRIKALSLVFDLRYHPFRAHIVANRDGFLPIPFVPVFVGVDEGFFQRQVDSVNLLF
jgi:hypothetical protein